MFPGGQASGGKTGEFVWTRSARARLWQHLFGRITDQPSCLPVNHDTVGDGMRRSWNGKRRNRRFQWLGCAVAIGVILVSSGCRRETQTTASSIYGQIENEFVLGNLPTALEHSNEALR